MHYFSDFKNLETYIRRNVFLKNKNLFILISVGLTSRVNLCINSELNNSSGKQHYVIVFVKLVPCFLSPPILHSHSCHETQGRTGLNHLYVDGLDL